MRALLDGDIVLYSCGYAAQHNEYTVRNEDIEVDCENKREANQVAKDIGGEVLTTTVVEPLSHALQNMDTMIRSTLKRVLADEHYAALKLALIEKYGAIVINGQEADDALAIAQMEYQDGTSKIPTIICTKDKDLDMVPGSHYRWHNDNLFVVSPEQGMRTFYKQIITGDPTDNISGLFRLTKKRATKPLVAKIDELETETEMWAYIKELFTDIPEEVIITNARLLWMCTREGELWEPPTSGECSETEEGAGACECEAVLIGDNDGQDCPEGDAVSDGSA